MLLLFPLIFGSSFVSFFTADGQMPTFVKDMKSTYKEDALLAHCTCTLTVLCVILSYDI